MRSSALDEDSPDYSFAGQYATVLAVSDVDSVADAVRVCARSGSSHHLRIYREATGQPDPGAPAVFIHKMVPAERAGVAFTVNPVTGARETVVEAAYGLGDLVVGGEITPDQIAVDDRGQVLRETVGSKRRMSLVTARGVTHITVSRDLRERISLSSAQLSGVVKAVRDCKAVLGYDVDIEWAIANEQVFVLQARPVTTRGTS